MGQRAQLNPEFDGMPPIDHGRGRTGVDVSSWQCAHGPPQPGPELDVENSTTETRLRGWVVRLELGNVEFSGGESWPRQRQSPSFVLQFKREWSARSGLRPNQLLLLRFSNT
jgi:hypothetical protein